MSYAFAKFAKINAHFMRLLHAKVEKNRMWSQRETRITLYLKTDFISMIRWKSLSRSALLAAFAKELYIKDTSDNYITKPGKNYKQVAFGDVSRLYHNGNWQFFAKTEDEQFISLLRYLAKGNFLLTMLKKKNSPKAAIVIW
jgi:hypothetical protein